MATERINDRQGQPESIPEESKKPIALSPAPKSDFPGFCDPFPDDLYEGDDPKATYWGLFDD